MSIGAQLVVARARWVARRAARERRRTLERELSGFRSVRELTDLEATLDRYPDGVTHELRAILARQAVLADQRRLPW